MGSNRIKLKDFLTSISENVLVDIVYHYISESGFRAKELFIKRPELENTYIKENGIEIYVDELDYILADNAEERKEELFESIKHTRYEYLIIEVED